MMRYRIICLVTRLLLLVLLFLFCFSTHAESLMLAEPLVLVDPIRADVSPLITDGSSSLAITQCQVSVQGFGYVLMILEDDEGQIQQTMYEFVASPTQPMTLSCGLGTPINVRSITITSLSGPLVLSSIQLWPISSTLTVTNLSQLQPDLVYWFSPSATVNVSGGIATSLAPLTTFQIALTAAGLRSTTVTTSVAHGSSWSGSVPGLFTQVPYNVTVTSFSNLYSYPVIFSVSSVTMSIPQTLLSCPPGYYFDPTDFSQYFCSACPSGEFSGAWSGYSYSDTCGSCPLGSYSGTETGASYCFGAVAHWSFDPTMYLNDSVSDYSAQFDGSFDGHLSITSTASVFGGGSLISDGSVPAWVAVEPFYFFCSATMDCHSRPQNSWSIALWFQPQAMNREHVLLADWLPGSNRYMGRINSQGGFDWLMVASPGNIQPYGCISSPTPVVFSNQWTHIVVTWDQFYLPNMANISIWINASRVATALYDSSVNITPSGGNFTQIGYASDNNVGFQGAIDELWLLNGSLSPDMISQLFKKNSFSLTKHIPSVLSSSWHSPRNLTA